MSTLTFSITYDIQYVSALSIRMHMSTSKGKHGNLFLEIPALVQMYRVVL